MESRALNFTMGEISLPDGEEAILLATPAEQIGAHDENEIMERAIGGLGGPDHFAALVDGKGEIQVATTGFSQLGIEGEALAALTAEAADEPDRLVKRMIAATGGRFPAGLARLRDEPALHLLVVIAQAQAEGDTAESDTAINGTAPQTTEPLPPASADNAASQHDYWYFSSNGARADRQAPKVQGEAGVADEREIPPVRFVWRTDAQGRFSALSHEFARAVGELAADVVGRRFRDVANIFGLDPSGEIAGLLERRDTWSGRSVLWPVAGTELKIPVDLAALPVYSREREFEGFRGFGVARPGDAVEDPEGLGLVLVAPARPAHDTPGLETGHVEDQTPDAEEDEAQEETPEAVDPFRGEVPALSIVPKPDRRFSDKIIRLAEHRPHAVPEKGLSSVERSAFREIGERLKKDGEAAAKALKETQAAKDQETAAATDEDAGKPTEAVLEDRDGVSPAEPETLQAQDETEDRESALVPDHAADVTEALGETEGKPADPGASTQEERLRRSNPSRQRTNRRPIRWQKIAPPAKPPMRWTRRPHRPAMPTATGLAPHPHPNRPRTPESARRGPRTRRSWKSCRCRC
jgi:hypothetical protein